MRQRQYCRRNRALVCCGFGRLWVSLSTFDIRRTRKRGRYVNIAAGLTTYVSFCPTHDSVRPASDLNSVHEQRSFVRPNHWHGSSIGSAVVRLTTLQLKHVTCAICEINTNNKGAEHERARSCLCGTRWSSVCITSSHGSSFTFIYTVVDTTTLSDSNQRKAVN